MNFPLFIARRIYGSQDNRRKVSKPAITIATVGVALGLAVMIATVSVVLGFKHSIRDKVVGFGGNITVANFLSLNSSDQFPVAMGDSMTNVLKAVPGVRHVSRYALKQGILKTDDDFLGVMLKGVGPEYDETFLKQNMVSGTLPVFSDSKSQNQIVISSRMAEKLNVKAGDRIYAYFINEQGIRTRRFTISGIYETNLQRFDETMCFTDLYTCVKLNGWEGNQTSGAELQVDNFDNLQSIADRVAAKVNRTVDRYGNTYSSATVQDLNPQIFSWLDLMDLNVWIILALMVAVAGVTMISGLLIIILERTRMIGVLKALGARNKTIRHIFLWFATFIIGRGLVIGNIIGLGLIALQRYTGLVRLDPQTYYVSKVPVEFNWPIIIALNVATLLICVFVLVAPSYLVTHIHPAKSMHYE